MYIPFRPRYRGTIIANVGMTRATRNPTRRRRLADLVAYGHTSSQPTCLHALPPWQPIERSRIRSPFIPTPHRSRRATPDYPPATSRPNGDPCDDLAGAEKALVVAPVAPRQSWRDDLHSPTHTCRTSICRCPRRPPRRKTIARLGPHSGHNTTVPVRAVRSPTASSDFTQPLLAAVAAPRIGRQTCVRRHAATCTHIARGILSLELLVHSWDFAVAA